MHALRRRARRPRGLLFGQFTNTLSQRKAYALSFLCVKCEDLALHNKLELVARRFGPAKNKKKKQKQRRDNVTFVEDSVVMYLSELPAGTQTLPAAKKFSKAMKEHYTLPTQEILQLINERPSTAVQVHLVIEECASRFSEEDVEQILDLIEEMLPAPPRVEGEHEEGNLASEGGDGEGEAGDDYEPMVTLPPQHGEDHAENEDDEIVFAPEAAAGNDYSLAEQDD